jgi:hypothetical protein
LAHKLELLKLGIKALQLNENAQEVLKALQALARRFDSVEEAWRVFYTTHLRNLDKKAGEIDEAYRKLRKEFQRIETVVSVNGSSGKGGAQEIPAEPGAAADRAAPEGLRRCEVSEGRPGG